MNSNYYIQNKFGINDLVIIVNIIFTFILTLGVGALTAFILGPTYLALPVMGLFVFFIILRLART